MDRARISLFVVALSVTLATPFFARASYTYGSNILQPSADFAEVPRNTRVWLGSDHNWSADDGLPALFDTDDQEIPFTVSRIDGIYYYGSLLVLTPDELLIIGEHYSLRWPDQDPDEEPDNLLEFLVTSPEDHEPPEPPEEFHRQLHSPTPQLGPSGWAANLFVESDSAVQFVDEGMFADLDEDAISGTVSDMSDNNHFMVGNGIAGTPECSDTTWGGSSPVRYAAYDLAGNFSGWSDAEDLELVGCHCTVGAADRPGAGWLVAALLVGGLIVWRRR